jgi:hypothetical protein
MISKITITLSFLTTISFNSFSQKTFTLTHASKNYTAAITVANCKGTEDCKGKASIKLENKSGKLLQTLHSDELYIYLDANGTVADSMAMYNEQSPLIFDDFNFDGTEDLAIRNGDNSGYGGPSYDVYVYNATKRALIKSAALTKLASTNLGMFEVDKKLKRLTTHQKSGAAWHSTTSYEVVPKKGLVKMYEKIEDAQDGVNVVVTEKKLVNGKWSKKSKKYKIAYYYKD